MSSSQRKEDIRWKAVLKCTDVKDGRMKILVSSSINKLDSIGSSSGKSFVQARHWKSSKHAVSKFKSIVSMIIDMTNSNGRIIAADVKRLKPISKRKAFASTQLKRAVDQYITCTPHTGTKKFLINIWEGEN